MTRKTRKDKGVMVVDKQARSLLPYFYSTKQMDSSDKKLITKMRIGTNKEIADALNMSESSYKRLCRKLRDMDEDEQLELLESELTIKGLKGLLKLVKERKEILKSGDVPTKRRRTVTKKTSKDERIELYESKKDELEKEWQEWE
ncbi:hypothetical protein O2U01_11260 (plasmid) [Ligilactobacillus salivarius]|uniref:Uncharacterized protein n=2 Tax=Ligilactobacillus salivarius TaxID=1624 RepID=A0AAQ3ESN0_9LACO|nr:hypothetical protein [Ligilactobacillus salivarius]OUQ32045.1 hypothetical protein B5E73_04685 [Ligilactobacillus salivarius]WHS05229.1 hypothetical protein O2U07_01090 [Ligilactobacillus salivarius]WHS07128.1 hypothetical protein O2U05_00730 [Ligilactobacillus salivarius]WHS07153.1 hypothetical protein O2U05_00010 [Ligilactobacillus salivarius]WHS11028.1 hypothetical protein O2U04_09555 [Ligilactobacillus salivarius]